MEMIQLEMNKVLTEIVKLATKANKEKKYWMVRTDNGFNYQSFYNNEYIALSLENYPLNIVTEAKQFLSKPLLARNFIKDSLKKYHKEGRIMLDKELDDKSYASVVGRIAGQIYSFAFEVKKDDIVLIPSEGSSKISIGKIMEDEMFLDNNIRTRNFTFKRKVKWITTIPKRKLDPCLYRALGAHQALSNISEYAEFIERNYNSIFSIGEECHYVLTVNSTKVKARQLSNMVNDMLNMLEDISKTYSMNLDVNSIDLSISLNSPGKIVLKSTITIGVLLMAIAASFSDNAIRYDNLDFMDNNVFTSLVQIVNNFRTMNEQIKEKYEYSDSYFNSLEVKSVEDWNEIMEREAAIVPKY